MTSFATVGGLMFAAIVLVVAHFRQDPTVIFLSFMFMLGVAPLLAASAIYLKDRCAGDALAALDVALLVAKAALLLALVSLIASLLATVLVRPGPALRWVVLGVFLAGVAAFLVLPRARSLRWCNADSLDAWLVAALAVAVLLLSPFTAADAVPVGLLKYAFSSENFLLWAVVGLVWLACGIWVRRREGWAYPGKKKFLDRTALLIVCIVILTLYDDSHFVDAAHYQPLVGPALHAMHGGLPMVDTYSQYGLLPWIVVRTAFAFFEPTFGTAAVVIRIVNLCYFIVVALILFFVSRRRLSALWFLIPALLVAITSHIPGPWGMWNMNSLPMTLGGRWLVPACMVLLLVAAPGRSWSRWIALVLIMLASVSSFDVLAFTLGPWAACLAIDSVRARSTSLFLKWMLLAAGSLALAQAALFTSIFLATGALVDYRPYFGLALTHRPTKESVWSEPFPTSYALWLPICLAYFLVISAAAYRALRRDPESGLSERLLPVAVLGLCPLAYFFGRPQEATLNISCLPFAIVAIAVAEFVFMKPRRFGRVGATLAVVMGISFAFIIADGFEHFMRPLDPSRGNASVLRRCLTAEGCRLADVPRNIALALQTQPLDPRTKVSFFTRDDVPRIEETISLLRRWAPDAPFVGLLTDLDDVNYANMYGAIGMTAAMATGQWYAWSISSTLNDQHSNLLVDRILKRVGETSSGMLVVVAHEIDRLIPLNRKILGVLKAHCRLKLVDTRKYHSAYITEDCGR